MNNNMIPLSLDDTFTFSCSERVSCFNECCRDLNQALTPYDILRLKKHLGLSSDIFLNRYTSQHIGPESGLPIITLKPVDTRKLKCPFVTPAGCRVYEDRPSSCRVYPLVRAASRSRETGKIVEQYLLLKEPHCLGFNENQNQTVRDWIENQGLTMYNQLNDMLMDIISLKNILKPGPLDVKSGRLFHMACYDLDGFRTHIFERGILHDQKVDPDILEAVKEDDVELLKLGLQWIKKVLLGSV